MASLVVYLRRSIASVIRGFRWLRRTDKMVFKRIVRETSLVSRVTSVHSFNQSENRLMLIALVPWGHKAKIQKPPIFMWIIILYIFSDYLLKSVWSVFTMHRTARIYTLIYALRCTELYKLQVDKSITATSKSLSVEASLSSPAGNNSAGDTSRGIRWPGLGAKQSRWTNEC